MVVMRSVLRRNLTFNRSVHCNQVSDQCPLGLLFNNVVSRHLESRVPQNKNKTVNVKYKRTDALSLWHQQ